LIRGLLIVVVIAGLAATAGWAVIRYARPLPYGWAVEVAILASLFGVWNGIRLAGPVFWYLLLGLPGVLAYRAIETVDGVVGRRDPARAGFGLAPTRLEDATSWLPARLTGVLLALAGGFVPGGSPLRVWRAISKARSAGAASAAAWVFAAAGGLGLSLGGPARWNGISVMPP
jgi:adenosylcobinamide-phosphate synthase